MERYINIAQKALEALKQAGADEAQCRLEVTDTEEVQAEAKRFNLMRSYSDVKLTLTAIKGKRMSEVSITRLNDNSIFAAAEDCIAALAYAQEDRFAGFAMAENNEDFTRGVLNGKMSPVIGRLIEFALDADQKYPDIIYECSGRYMHTYKVLMNTNDVRFTDENGYYNISASFMGTKGAQTTSFGPGASFTLLEPDVRLIDYGNTQSEMELAMKLLDPRPAGDKFVGVMITAPTLTAELFDMLTKIALTDAPVTAGTSRFSGRLGERVANDRLTFSFAPLSKGMVAGERFTSDGYAAHNCTPIKEGVLREYMLSRHGAEMSGLKRAKNSGGSMVIKAGSAALDEIIASVEHGVLVGRYSGTVPDVSGELSGVAKNSFLIKHGKIVCPVVETMISGNLFDMLCSVRAVSKDVRADGESVLPYMAFEGITIK